MKFRLIGMILCTIWLSEVWTVRIEIQEFVLVHFSSASPPNTFWCICNSCPDFFILFVSNLFIFYMQLFEFLLTIVGSAKLITVCCKDFNSISTSCLLITYCPFIISKSFAPLLLQVIMNNVKELTYNTIGFLQITEQQVGMCFAIRWSFPFLHLSTALSGSAEKYQIYSDSDLNFHNF